MRDAVLGGTTPGGGGRVQGVRDCDAWDPERGRAGERGGECAGEADCDEHASAGGEPDAVQQNRGDRRWAGARGGDQAEPLRGERVQAVPRGAVLASSA